MSELNQFSSNGAGSCAMLTENMLRKAGKTQEGGALWGS